METGAGWAGLQRRRVLETFLVEWKPEEDCLKLCYANGLETFLVEWKLPNLAIPRCTPYLP